ncbi:hypothetical protein K432DRAFT_63786 [Lepidopterella palustris CBS 459.81]|uniref:Uncharacterized protein n=1 Tax=Lepidopterella palustris CBS 459.81 TaxID=1314670 RepID=A0A8E2JEE4_9PEZI|nr:hypothetical protein K432DRAFT_63786 [Lepidopterella palustris CBS 459.81]
MRKNELLFLPEDFSSKCIALIASALPHFIPWRIWHGQVPRYEPSASVNCGQHPSHLMACQYHLACSQLYAWLCSIGYVQPHLFDAQVLDVLSIMISSRYNLSSASLLCQDQTIATAPDYLTPSSLSFPKAFHLLIVYTCFSQLDVDRPAAICTLLLPSKLILSYISRWCEII